MLYNPFNERSMRFAVRNEETKEKVHDKALRALYEPPRCIQNGRGVYLFLFKIKHLT